MRTILQERQKISKSLLWMFSIIGGLALANLYYCQALLNLISIDFQIDEFMTNLIALCTQVGYTMGLLLVIPLADLQNRRKLLLLVLSILAMALFFMGCSPNIYCALTASLVIGVCSVVPQLFIPMTSQYSTSETKAKNISIVMSGALTGIVLARVVGGFAGEYLGWRSIFFIASVLIFGSTIAIYRRLPNFPVNYRGHYWELMKSLWTLTREYPALRIASFKAAFSFASFLAMWSCLAFKMVQPPFHANNMIIGMLGLSGIAGTFSTLLVGKYIHVFGSKKLTTIGCLVLFASWLSVYWGQNNYAGIIAGVLLVNMGMQCVQICNQASILSLSPQASNRLNTIFMAICFAGGSIGTLLSGMAWEWYGWTGVVAVGMILSFCSLAINLSYREKQP